MRLAFVLFKYFPYGGLQRDFLRIAQACQARGHSVEAFCLEQEGEPPPGIPLHIAPIRAFSRHTRNDRFTHWIKQRLAQDRFDAVVGFNKMAGLDVYYAADPCFAEKATTLRGPLYRLSPRYRHFRKAEEAVFSPDARTGILMIADSQIPQFIKHYGTPRERFHLLPPGIAKDRCRPADAAAQRVHLRHEFNIGGDEHLFLSIGSGFRTKGVDRTLVALSQLDGPLLSRARLIVIGQDNPTPVLRQAKQLGLGDRVTVLSGRSDITRFLVGADTLLHPAYSETAGMVLLEALVAGLPVVVTATCGYAHYINRANAGVVLEDPFSPTLYKDTLALMMNAPEEQRARWQRNALDFAATADIYSLPEHAAGIIEETIRARLSRS